MYILTALMGFALGLLTGVGVREFTRERRKTERPPAQEDPAIIRARKEYENFFAYDGSEQEEIF